MDQTIYEKFLDNTGEIKIEKNKISVQLKKKRTLPLVLEKTNNFSGQKYEWLNNLEIFFTGATNS